jgi:hypothetical protein
MFQFELPANASEEEAAAIISAITALLQAEQQQQVAEGLARARWNEAARLSMNAIRATNQSPKPTWGTIERLRRLS